MLLVGQYTSRTRRIDENKNGVVVSIFAIFVISAISAISAIVAILTNIASVRPERQRRSLMQPKVGDNVATLGILFFEYTTPTGLPTRQTHLILENLK
jgi:uncharacterized BrkB/YihY/UPF0761 family membrane protein